MGGTYRDLHRRRVSWRNKNYRRRAQAKGLTVEEYLEQKLERQTFTAEEKLTRLEAKYERLEQRAKRDDMAEERAEEQRQRKNEDMLARYHADPKNWSTYKKRQRLFERDGYRCRGCGKKVRQDLPNGHPDKAVAMHILAKATGGEWTEENMATGCWECNVKDGVNRLPLQTHIRIF